MPPNASNHLKRFTWIALLIIATAAALLAFALENIGVPPRSLSPYVERRASGHNPLIVGIGEWVGQSLMAADRGKHQLHNRESLRIGAQTNEAPLMVANNASITPVFVASVKEAAEAIAHAHPGDVITFMPGTYRLRGPDMIASQPGTKTAGITVRAAHPGTVILELNAAEGFLVSAPYWTFENLTIRGVCKVHSYCEHAFHVTAKAMHFTARNNTILDFNAHFKINGGGGYMPDHGLIEGNTLSNTSVRETTHSVTLIDLVAASHWVIRRNLISDFIKGQGDKISYGAFAKGAGSNNKFEQNIVLCEHLLQGVPGQRVGLSLGGGATGKAYCRDKRCITEQDGGVIQSNLIASCSDDGIYLNRAATSTILHNTLIDTGGITVRFPETSADVEGNLIDGTIRNKDDGLLRATDNIETTMTRLYLGLHPVRELYADPTALNFLWSGSPLRRNAVNPVPLDLCGMQRPAMPAYGAFENFSACLQQTKNNKMSITSATAFPYQQ